MPEYEDQGTTTKVNAPETKVTVKIGGREVKAK